MPPVGWERSDRGQRKRETEREREKSKRLSQDVDIMHICIFSHICMWCICIPERGRYQG